MKSLFTEEYKIVLRALVTARKAAGLKQQELAVRLGRPQSFVSKYERSERRIDAVELVLLAHILGLDPCQIIRDVETHLAAREAKRHHK